MIGAQLFTAVSQNRTKISFAFDCKYGLATTHQLEVLALPGPNSVKN